MIDNYASVRAGIKYGWLPEEKAVLYSHSPEFRFLYMTYVDDRSLMSLNYNLGWTFLTKSQWQGSFNFIYNIESLRDSLELLEDGNRKRPPMPTRHRLQAVNCTRSLRASTLRSPRTRASRFPITKTRLRQIRADLPSWKILSCAKKSRISTMSAFPSASCTHEGRAYMDSSS